MGVGRKEIFLLLTSVFLTLMMSEIGARIWLHNFSTIDQFQKYALYTEIDPKNWFFSPHPYLNYYLTPNYKSGLKYHNSLGYRDKDFPIRKPSGEYRIAVLGGSTIYTSAVDDNGKTFPSQLENILKNEYGYNNIKVINAGVPGYSTWESLINLEFRVLDLDPNLVIIYPCVNDITQRMVLPSSYRGDNTGSRKQWSLPRVKPFEYSCFLRIISRKLGFTEQIGIGHGLTMADTNLVAKFSGKKEGIPYGVLKDNPPDFFERNLHNMVAISKEHNVKIMFSTFAHSLVFGMHGRYYFSTELYELEYRRHNLLVKDIAETHDIPIFNFASVMLQDLEYWADPVHVNEKGALLKAKLFADFIYHEGLIK